MVAAVDKHRALFVSVPGNPPGKHTCKFFKEGKWVFVDVDDRIPCLAKDRTPCYGRNRDINEYWVAVLEKAYAKYHTCYEALIDGEVDYGLHDLTGGVPTEITLSDEKVQEGIENGTFFSDYISLKKQGHEILMGCAIVQDVDCHEVDVGQGMLLNHAYSLLDISDALPGKTMLKIRNPWGCGEWQGKWSDQDTTNWTPEAQDVLQHHLDGTDDDGTFWMEGSDFASIVTHMYVCMIPKGWWTIHRQGKWQGESAGGRVTCPTWKFNPMLQLTITQTTKSVICLYQRDARIPTAGLPWNEYTSCIGFVVYRAGDDGSPKPKLKAKDVVIKARAKEDREVSVTVDLEPGIFYVVPNTFDAGEEGQFELMLHTETQISCVGLNVGCMEGQDSVVAQKYESSVPQSGGQCNDNSFYESQLMDKDTRIRELEDTVQQLQEALSHDATSSNDELSELKLSHSKEIEKLQGEHADKEDDWSQEKTKLEEALKESIERHAAEEDQMKRDFQSQLDTVQREAQEQAEKNAREFDERVRLTVP